MTPPGTNDNSLYNAVDRHEYNYFRCLIELTDTVVNTGGNIFSLAQNTADALHAFFRLDFISVETFDSTNMALDAHSIIFDRQQRSQYSHDRKPLTNTLLGAALLRHESILFSRKTMIDKQGIHPFIDELVRKGLQVLLYYPLVVAGKLLGTLAVGSTRHSHFTPDIMELLERTSRRMAVAINALLSHTGSDAAREHPVLPADSIPVEDNDTVSPHSIIGSSPAISAILQQIETVASSDATVLLQGETGTGKGLIAQTIHDLSARNMREMVKMNCTAIPSDLMESELFGHEKGAFTGALNRRIGHFEQADKSTLFLDEIGDMPLELQPKLLSVLQEHQIRRLGGAGIIPVDVRIIAATNCDLPAKIADKTFRSDLYYRLNVFPITIPPLRERKEDIPLLAKFFIRKYARQMNRQITRIPEETLDMMTRLPWPGNIRELENVMERAVILTNRGTVLNLTPESLSTFTAQTLFATSRPSGAGTPAAPLPPVDKDAIIAALRETGGQIGGKSGAAARVGLKRTTFLARLKRLGINADDFRQPEADSTGIGENI